MSEFTDFMEAYDKFLTDKKLTIASHDAEEIYLKSTLIIFLMIWDLLRM